MSNETNEGIIIKGGASNKSQGYYIPTMKGFWIMVGTSGDVRHSPRILKRESEFYRRENI